MPVAQFQQTFAQQYGRILTDLEFLVGGDQDAYLINGARMVEGLSQIFGGLEGEYSWEKNMLRLFNIEHIG